MSNQRTRATRAANRPAGPPPDPVCTCHGRPWLRATFRDGNLTAVELVHWAGRDKCPMPVEAIDPDRYAPRRRLVMSAQHAKV